MTEHVIQHDGQELKIVLRGLTAGKRAAIHKKYGQAGLSYMGGVLGMLSEKPTQANLQLMLSLIQDSAKKVNDTAFEQEIELMLAIIAEAPFPLTAEGLQEMDTELYDQVSKLVRDVVGRSEDVLNVLRLRLSEVLKEHGTDAVADAMRCIAEVESGDAIGKP